MLMAVVRGTEAPTCSSVDNKDGVVRRRLHLCRVVHAQPGGFVHHDVPRVVVQYSNRRHRRRRSRLGHCFWFRIARKELSGCVHFAIKLVHLPPASVTFIV